MSGLYFQARVVFATVIIVSNYGTLHFVFGRENTSER